MTDWIWVTREVIDAVHERQLAEHGGAAGLRDGNALDSALARPVNLALYGEPDAADLAAAVAFGIARNHPYADGNKRSAWIAARLFLRLNRVVLRFDPHDATQTVLALAAGGLSEDALAAWFRDRTVGPSREA